MGIPRAEFELMSVPEMLDHIEYLQEVNRGD